MITPINIKYISDETSKYRHKMTQCDPRMCLLPARLYARDVLNNTAMI